MYKEYQDEGIHSEGFIFTNSCLIAIENTFVYYKKYNYIYKLLYKQKYIDRKYIINVLKNTKKNEIEKFLSSGLLRILNSWISEYKISFPQFVCEILELITNFPINKTIILNNSNQINKVIKELSKDSSVSYIQKQSLLCMEKWKLLLHEEKVFIIIYYFFIIY